MPFSKNFFRLRRRGANRRKSGYYWVHWSYGGTAGKNDVWRIGYYNAFSQKWSITGDSRYFDDGDFIAINEYQILGFWSQYRVFNFLLCLALIEMAWNAGYIIYNVIEYFYRLTK